MPCLAERVCTIKPLVCNEGRHIDIHLTAVLTHVLPYAFCGVMRLVDLFAGLGGFSAGAIEAGAEVILGVDSDPVPLKLWSANVPGGTAHLATLGEGGDQTNLHLVLHCRGTLPH